MCFQWLREIEDEIPDCHKLLNAEYHALYTKEQIGIARYENRLTWIFTIMFAGFGVVIVIALLRTFLQ
jgi:hypothetical protein